MSDWGDTHFLFMGLSRFNPLCNVCKLHHISAILAHTTSLVFPENLPCNLFLRVYDTQGNKVTLGNRLLTLSTVVKKKLVNLLLCLSL